MTIQEALNLHEDSLILLSFVLNKNKTWILANQKVNLTPNQSKHGSGQAIKQLAEFKKLINLRKQDWPVAYLVGAKEFYGLEFGVAPDVLIPRPESELLVELALDKIQNAKFKVQNVVDIGTGSGNLIISIAKTLTSKEYDRLVYDTPRLIGIDSSEKALAVARQNAEKHGVADKIEFLRGNLLDPLIQNTKYEIRNTTLLANLPYLSSKQLNNLTIKHEPQQALYGGPDGLSCHRELLSQLETVKTDNLYLIIECLSQQAYEIKSLASNTNLQLEIVEV